MPCSALTLLALLALLTPARAADGQDPPGPTNVLIYLVDTVRADHLGPYGYERRTTPYLDRLARDGVVFTRAYAQASWTKPAVASILTGKHPRSHQLNAWNSAMSGRELTLSRILEQAGHDTAAFVTNVLVSGKFGFQEGFGTFEHFGGMHALAARHLTDRAVDHLRSGPQERPFFLYLHASDPHAPYTPPKGALEALGAAVEDPHVGSTEGRSRLGPAAAMTPQTLSQVKSDLEALYDGEIAHTDRQLGRLLKQLKNMGLADNTLIVVLSDHGEEFYDHGLLGHGDTLYVEQLHIPLVVKFPRNWQAGRRVDAIARQVDVLPTVLDVLGLSRPAGVDGRSLLPVLADEVQPPVTSIAYLDLKPGLRQDSIVWQDFHLIRTQATSEKPTRIELYDLSHDAHERVDVAEREPEIVAELVGLLDAHAAASAELLPSPTQDVDAETAEHLRALGYTR